MTPSERDAIVTSCNRLKDRLPAIAAIAHKQGTTFADAATKHDAIKDYFTDAWDFGLVDFETPDCAFFKVNAADLHEFPELSGVYGLRLTGRTFTEYADAVQYVQAVAEEAGR